MLKIRFQRKGKKNRPFFEIVLTEKHKAPKGKFLEILGYYDPFKKEKDFKEDRIKYWLEKGAQLSPSLHNLLVSANILKKSKVSVHSTKKRKKQRPAKEKPKKEEKEVKEEVKKEEKPKEKEPEETKSEEKEAKKEEAKEEPKKDAEGAEEKKKPAEKEKKGPKKEKPKEKKESGTEELGKELPETIDK